MMDHRHLQRLSGSLVMSSFMSTALSGVFSVMLILLHSCKACVKVQAATRTCTQLPAECSSCLHSDGWAYCAARATDAFEALSYQRPDCLTRRGFPSAEKSESLSSNDGGFDGS